MRVIKTIEYPEEMNQPTLVNSDYAVHYMEAGDSVRVGFANGTLKKVSFELKNGHKITYEAKDEN